MNNKPASFAERLRELMAMKGLTKTELAKLCGINRSNITRYCNGDYEAKQDVIYRMAAALNVSEAWLMGYDVPSVQTAKNIMPVPGMRRIPLVGTIACGDPVLAEENIEGDVSIPENIHADFALRCKGDSMINARIFDGDIVYIKQQDTVESGEIAAVLIDDEATLKRVRLYSDHIALEPENPQYRPLVFWGDDAETIIILGKAVAFTGAVR